MLLWQITPVVVKFFLHTALLLESLEKLALEDAFVQTDQQLIPDEGDNEVIKLITSRAVGKGRWERVTE